MNQMKIVAGLGSVEEYIRYVEAGASECFCGYVPYTWAEKYKTISPLNRREVQCYQVQLGSFEELKILSKMIEVYQVPVKITLNSLYYQKEQYKEILELIGRCIKIGLDTFIIADPALIWMIDTQKLPCKIHVSGEFGEMNSIAMEAWKTPQVTRYIFHRKNQIREMQEGIRKMQERGEKLEYEAFLFNELCHYAGAYCNSIHCDELPHICRVPYELRPLAQGVPPVRSKENEEEIDWDREPVSGESGCGLCALGALRKAGITHLKVVGRGNHVDLMEEDIRTVKRALDLLEAEGEKGFQERMKQELFFGKCSGNCYYLGQV